MHCPYMCIHTYTYVGPHMYECRKLLMLLVIFWLVLGLFNNTFNCLCYVESNSVAILWINYKKCGKKGRDLFEETCGIRPDGLNKTARNISEDSWPFNRDLNLVLPQYEAGMLTSLPWNFVFKYLNIIIRLCLILCVWSICNDGICGLYA